MADSSSNRQSSAIHRGGTGTTPTPANTTTSSDDTSTRHNTLAGLHSSSKTTSNASPSDDSSTNKSSSIKEAFRTSASGTNKEHLPGGSGLGMGGVSGLGIGGGGGVGNSSFNSKGVPPESGNVGRTESSVTGSGFTGGRSLLGGLLGKANEGAEDSGYNITEKMGHTVERGTGRMHMGGKPVAKDFLENYKEEIKDDA